MVKALRQASGSASISGPKGRVGGGVVDEDVEAAEGSTGAGDRLVEMARVGHVAVDRRGRAAPGDVRLRPVRRVRARSAHTDVPSAISAAATASPMPREAPVTSATRP